MEISEAAYCVSLLLNCVIFSGVRLGLETSHLAGDSWIQGGTILLDQDGNILYQVPEMLNSHQFSPTTNSY